MRARRALLVALGAFAIVALTSKGAVAGTHRLGTSVSATSVTSKVSGVPVNVRVRLTDERGHAVGGALIRLSEATTFLGASRDEVLDEATTSSSGRAVLQFSPVEAGTATVRLRFEGDATYAPAQASIAFDVLRPVETYQASPPGIRAPWAHAYLILVPFMGIWLTYAVVLAQVRRVRRAGPRDASA